MFKYLLIIVLYISISYLPAIGSVDRSQTQWLSLSILNLISIILIYNSISLNELKKLLKNTPYKWYLFFLISCLVSIFYSINMTESLIVFSRYFVQFLSAIVLFFSLKKTINPFVVIASLLSVGVFIESAVINYIFYTNYDPLVEYGRSGLNKGLTSNINIAAFSMVMKIPFVIYLFAKYSNKIYITLLGLILISFTFFAISITGSRGALLTIYFQIISYLLIFFLSFTWNKLHKVKKALKKSLILILCGFFMSSIVNELVFDTLRVSYRTQQIIDRGSDSRLDYYKQAIEAFKVSPIRGNGVGTWKILSIFYDRNTQEGYTVQYNAHNDFLQLATEIGIFGLFFYLMIFFRTAFFQIKNLITPENLLITIFLISYFIDANLNFPIDRPVIQIMLILSIALTSVNLKKI